MKSQITIIEPSELYNLLNQVSLDVPCIANECYLLLLDTRKLEEYNTSHIVHATHVPFHEKHGYVFPKQLNYSSIQHIVVMDNRTCSLKEIANSGMMCAELLWNMGSKYPVKLVKGGFEDFSAFYPFLRTQKILYTQREVAMVKMYPVEIVSGFLYLGTRKHAEDTDIAKHLKIKAHVNVTTHQDPRFTSDNVNSQLLQVNIADRVEVDIMPHFSISCSFIEEHEKAGAILVYSDLGISRCVTIVLAYLVNKNKISLKEAVQHVSKCHKYICPNRAFVSSLKKWEEDVLGQQLTKCEDLGFLSYE